MIVFFLAEKYKQCWLFMTACARAMTNIYRILRAYSFVWIFIHTLLLGAQLLCIQGELKFCECVFC